MNLLELKKILGNKIEVIFSHELMMNEDGNQEYEYTCYNCYINRKYSKYDFKPNLDKLKDSMVADLISINSVLAQKTLNEYIKMNNDFTNFILDGKEYLKYSNLDIYDDQTGDMGEFHLSKIKDITNPIMADTINKISQDIKEVLNEITDYIEFHFIVKPENDSSLEHLNVKQQILLLHYLFTFYSSSSAEIPNNKLSLLLAKLLGRNNETIRGLLTQMPTVENSETDNKIAKTPKNLSAIFDLLNAIKLPQLSILVEKDLRKLEK